MSLTSVGIFKSEMPTEKLAEHSLHITLNFRNIPFDIKLHNFDYFPPD